MRGILCGAAVVGIGAAIFYGYKKHESNASNGMNDVAVAAYDNAIGGFAPILPIHVRSHPQTRGVYTLPAKKRYRDHIVPARNMDYYVDNVLYASTGPTGLTPTRGEKDYMAFSKEKVHE